MSSNKHFKLSGVSKEEELEAIKALPSDFVSVSIPSKRIENLLVKRKNDHDAVLLAMQEAFRDTNLSVAEKMRREFADLEKRLRQLDEHMDLIINSELKDDTIEEAVLIKDYFRKRMEKIHKLHGRQSKAVEELHRNLLELEKKRSEMFVMVLKECFAKMHKIYYQLPHDLQEYFENEILKINQTTLANHRCYEYFRFYFKSQIQNTLRIRIYEIMECEKSTEKARRKGELNTIISEKMFSSIPKPSDVFSALRKAGNADDELDFPDQSQELKEMWASQTHKTVDYLENNAKILVDLFKDAVMLVFNRFFDELKDIAEVVITNSSSLHQQIAMDDVAKEIYHPLMESFVETYGCDLEELKELWTSITDNMEEKIVETYGFLNGCMFLFDEHLTRLNLVQTLILKDLHNVIQKNDWDSQISEKKINQVIDQLRQESTKENLDKLLKQSDKLLDSIAKTFAVQCRKEIKVIEKYKVFVTQEIDLVIVEIERFLDEHKTHEKDATIQRKRGSQISINEEEERKYALVPQQMKQCQFQVDCIFNWMFGLWEGVHLYLKECRQDVTRKAEAWADKQIQMIEKRLEVKMAVHLPRYHRIRHVLYDKRLEEINAHAAKLKFLEEAASKEFEIAKDINLNRRKHNISIIKDYMTRIEEIEEKQYHKALTVRQIQAYLHGLTVRTNEALAALTADRDESESFGHKAQNRIAEGTLSFLRGIKLFGEGGNYCAAEVASVKKRVKRLTKAVPKKFAVISLDAKKDLNKASEEVMKIDALLRNRLAESEEEFEHNEWTVSQIKQLKNAIRHKVYDAKCKLRNVKAYSEAFQCAISKHASTRADAGHQQVLKDYAEAVEEVGKLMRFLLRPNLKEFKSKVAVKKDPIVNYVDELFNIIPIADDGSYVSKLNHLIYESLIEVQRRAEKFYADHPAIINEGKVQPNFNAFMDEVMGTYLGYQVQCEYNWLEMLNQLICHNLDVLHYIDGLYDKTMKNYLNDGLSKYKNDCDAITKRVDKEKRKIQDEYTKIKEKTECFLDDIENVLNKIHGDAKKRIKELLVEPYKEQLERDFKTIKDESRMIHQNFQELIADETLKNYTATLLEEFKDGVELIDNLLEIQLLDFDDDKKDAAHAEIDSIISDTVQRVSVLKIWLEEMDRMPPIEEDGGIVIFIKNNHQQLLHEYNKVLTKFDRLTAWTEQMHSDYIHLFVNEDEGPGH